MIEIVVGEIANVAMHHRGSYFAESGLEYKKDEISNRTTEMAREKSQFRCRQKPNTSKATTQ
jgi:hypothetical protein